MPKITPERLHAIRDRHWGEERIPEHDVELMRERNGCDTCLLLLLVDSQTGMLSRLMAAKEKSDA